MARPPYELDGWRIDVANMTGRRAGVDVTHEVARQVRNTAVAVRRDALVLAEHGHDASEDLDGDGWHGTMNYVGFSYPVWSWLVAPGQGTRGFGLPVPVPRRGAGACVATIRSFLGRFGWRAVCTSWNILGSHDSARIRTVNGEDARRTIPWDTASSWDRDTLSTYADLAGLRRSHIALRRGGLRWVHVSEDAMVYLREHPEGSVLVVAARTDAGTLTVPVGPLGLDDGAVLFGTAGTHRCCRAGKVLTRPWTSRSLGPRSPSTRSESG